MNTYYCDTCVQADDLPRSNVLRSATCWSCQTSCICYEYEDMEDSKLPENIPDSRFDASFDAIFGKI